MISIIIPIYNHSKIINKCLVSIFNQTEKDFEVIAVDDGSTDDLTAAIRPWENKIQYFSQANQGAGAARNFGFQQSRGEYVLFCDADVEMKPEMLKKMLNALLENPNAAYAYSSFKFGWKKFKLWPFDSNKLQKMPYIHTVSLLRREFFSGFDESLKKFQDWDLWLQILKNGGHGVWIDEVLFKAKTGGTMSQWLPSCLYRLPWLALVKKYKKAEKIIKEKHGL